MRKIKVRGFSLSESKWLYGIGTFTGENGSNWLVVEESVFGNHSRKAYEVISESVGQFTGVEDKNGKEICEGDILQGYAYQPTTLFVVKFESSKYCCSFIASEPNKSAYINIWYEGLEVIGNVYENPELLGDKV